MAEEIAALTRSLKSWQQDGSTDHAEAQLAIALTRVIENQVRPRLAKKLKPADVDDVCSEVVLGFWKFRHSVRPDETGKLVNTLVQRKLNDQLRGYYKDAEHVISQKSEDEHELFELLTVRSDKPEAEVDQDVWEMLYSLELSAQDHLVAYLVYLGIEKNVIAEILEINTGTVSTCMQRCRKAIRNQSNNQEEAGHA